MSTLNTQQNMLNGWKRTKLGDVASVQTGPFGSQLHNSDYVDDGTPIITVENLVDGKIQLTRTTPLVADEDVERLSKYVLMTGDVVFSRVGAVDRSAYCSEVADGWMFSGRILRVRPHNSLDPKFLNYYLSLEVVKNRIRNHAVGGTMASLNTGILNAVPIIVPDIDEQKRIVGVLEVWDEYLERLDKKIELKKDIKKGLMQQLLTGKTRLPGFSGEWQTYKLADLGATYAGITGKTKNDFGSGSPFISYMNIFSNTAINSNRYEYVDLSDGKKQNSVSYGDILFTTSSETPQEVGISSVYLEENNENVYLNSFCFGFRLDNFEKLAPKFARYFFRGEVFRKSMTRIAQGASRYNLSKRYFMDTGVQIPKDSKEQIQIAIVLETADEEIDVLLRRQRIIANQKKHLLNNLVTGKIRTPENLTAPVKELTHA